MDILGGFKTEVFRPVLMLMIPGLVVGTPALFVLEHYQSGLFGFVDSNPTLSTFIGFVAAVILGLLTYEIGTNIEAHGIDKVLSNSDSKFKEDWYRYLRCILSEGSVAQNYIHDRVLYLKFELGMASASPLCLILSFWAWVIRDDFHYKWFAILVFSLVIGTVYFLFEAKQSGAGLARVRKELLKGVGSPPKCGEA